MRFDAVITAGGRIDGAYAREAGTSVKALARLGGVTMLERAIEALRGAGAERIAVVGDAAVRDVCGGHVERAIDDGGSGGANLRRALRAWPDERPLLYATSDLPYVDGASVRAFVEQLSPETLALPLATHEAYVARFPEAPPCGIALAGERVVNGGLFWLPAGSRARIERVAVALFDARKHPFAMARIVGPAILLRALLGTLSVELLEARARERLGIPARAVRDSRPELAFDADTVAEYRYALAHR